MEEYLYSVGDRIEAAIPGNVTVTGIIVGLDRSCVGSPVYYNVLQDEVTVVLDS